MSCVSLKKQKKENTATQNLIDQYIAVPNDQSLSLDQPQVLIVGHKSDVPVIKEDNTKSFKENINSPTKLYTSSDLGMEYFDADCTDCKRKWKEPSKDELSIFLHAVKYKVNLYLSCCFVLQRL